MSGQLLLARLLLALALLAGCSAPQAAAPPSPANTPAANTPAAAALPADAYQTALVAPKLYTYRVLDVYPHDPTAFTQGLIVRGSEFLEGTGQEGQSTLRRVAIESGEVLAQHALDAQYFGEGITELDGKIYQLTWRNATGFVYDAETLAPQGQFSYNTEGWGITHDGERLIVSDGTSLLQFWDPETLQPVGGVAVSLFGLPIANINELEYIDGEIYANIWQTNLIMRIDPASGNVTGVIDLTGLLANAPASAAQTSGQIAAPDVLNGIAFDPATGRLYVTGKYWPAVFAIELLETPA
jgi:glutamine cyclotransferase